MAPKKRKDVPTTTQVYLVPLEERRPYDGTTTKTVGLYSTKALAIRNAQAAFEEHSNGFFKGGRFTEPEIFDRAEDNSRTIGDSGVLFLQQDREGERVSVTLEQVAIDQEYTPAAECHSRSDGAALGFCY